MQELFKSKRFWLTIASVATVALKDYLPLSADQITQIILAIGAWVVGDSLRQTAPPSTPMRRYG